MIDWATPICAQILRVCLLSSAPSLDVAIFKNAAFLRSFLAHSLAHNPVATKGNIIYNFQGFIGRRRHFLRGLVNCQQRATVAKHSPSRSYLRLRQFFRLLQTADRPGLCPQHRRPTCNQAGADTETNVGSRWRERGVITFLTALSRHPPVAAGSTVRGKMAATTAVRMTDQREEAEAAGEREEGGGLSQPPALRGGGGERARVTLKIWS